jgi:hypothetical protein
MIHRFSSRLAAAIAASAAAVAAAQTQAPAPTAPTPTVTYRSTFDGYQPFNDQQVGSWKDANDNVGRIGGWRAYAKEAQQGEGKGEGKPTEAPAAAPAHPPSHKH